MKNQFPRTTLFFNYLMLERIRWGTLAFLMLFLGLIIISIAADRVFGSTYPGVVFVIAAIILSGAILLNAKFMSAMVVVGYCAGFVIAYILGEDVYSPPHRSYIHNWWGLWNVWFFRAIATGIVLDILKFLKYALKTKNR